MGTRGAGIFGKVSRATALLVGVVAASAALSLVVVLSDPKPAEAAGETWHGTVEFSGGGAHVRYEAPRGQEATWSARVNSISEYPFVGDPSTGPCQLVKEEFVGTGEGSGSLSVSDVGPDGKYHINAHPNEYMQLDRLLTYMGRGEDGSDCARTETITTHWWMWGSVQSDQDLEDNYHSGQVTTNLSSGSCTHVPEQNCAEMFPGGTEDTTARWSVARDVCSGYSRSWNLGEDDTLLLFNPLQTKCLAARTSFLDDLQGVPEICKVSYSDVPDVTGWSDSKVKEVLHMTKEAAEKLFKVCDAYQLMLRVELARNDWFLYNAANNDACGVWVVKDDFGVPPRIVSATRDSDGLGVAWVSPGETEQVRTSTGGTVSVSCPLQTTGGNNDGWGPVDPPPPPPPPPAQCTKTGTANAETIKGTTGADVICGLGGNDTIKGIGGNDTLRGGDGNDKLFGGPGDDALDGGLGTDAASYSASLTAVTASLATNAATGEGSDTFADVENLLGSPKADALTGSGANNALTGGGGNDTLRAGAGNDKVVGSGGDDFLYGEDGNDAVNSKDGVNGNDRLDGGAGTDTKVSDSSEASIVGFP